MSQKNALGLLTILISFLFLVTGCGGVFSAQPKSFTTYKTIYDSFDDDSDDDGGSHDTSKRIKTSVELREGCHIGELDIIHAFAKCTESTNLIVTIKDKNGERLAQSFGASLDIKDMKKLKKAVSSLSLDLSYTGDFDLFVCIDGNNNGQCTDEPLFELNTLNALAMMAQEGIAELMKKKNDLDCSRFKKLGASGLLVYHKHIDVDAKPGSVAGNAADAVAELLQNEEANGEEVLAAGLVENEDFAMPDVMPVEKEIRYNRIYKDENGEDHLMILLNVSNPKECLIGRRTNGCFAKGTKIQIAKGMHLSVEKLGKGYSVLLANGKFSKIKKVIKGPELKPVHVITLANKKTITLTETHPMLTPKGVVMAKDLKQGVKLKTVSGEWSKVVTINKLEYKGQVYNFELSGEKEEDHLVIANEIVSGDLYLQNKLSTEAIKTNLARTK